MAAERGDAEAVDLLLGLGAGADVEVHDPVRALYLGTHTAHTGTLGDVRITGRWLYGLILLRHSAEPAHSTQAHARPQGESAARRKRHIYVGRVCVGLPAQPNTCNTQTPVPCPPLPRSFARPHCTRRQEAGPTG